MTVYAYPPQAYFGKSVPKSKIYEHSKANTALKDMFVREVEEIVWAYKLAENTVRLHSTPTVKEIQVFRIVQKGPTYHENVLRAIDTVVPFPIIFEMIYDNTIQTVAAYKQFNETDSSRWTVGDYNYGLRVSEDKERTALPVALDIGGLYESLLAPLVERKIQSLVEKQTPIASTVRDLNHEPVNSEIPKPSLKSALALAEQIQKVKKKISVLESRLRKEKQFNKQIPINAELRSAKKELEGLIKQHCLLG